MARGSSQFAALLGVVVLLLRVVPAPAQAGASATVIGTEAADLRSCPQPACAVRAEVPLRSTVAITGAPVDGFVPVRFEDKSGFVYGRYLYGAMADAGQPELNTGSPGCSRIALIFNIGAGHTPSIEILDTLETKDVPATMFVMGWWAEQNPDLVRRMVDAGFPIGSHGYLPPELTLRSDWDVAEDIRLSGVAIEAAIGQPPGPWFTPFAAAIDDRIRAIAAAQGYLPVGWTVETADWDPETSAAAIYDRVLGGAFDGGIVELHLDAAASPYTTAVALPGIIDDLRARGFHFVTIPEMAEPCPATDGEAV